MTKYRVIMPKFEFYHKHSAACNTAIEWILFGVSLYFTHTGLKKSELEIDRLEQERKVADIPVKEKAMVYAKHCWPAAASVVAFGGASATININSQKKTEHLALAANAALAAKEEMENAIKEKIGKKKFNQAMDEAAIREAREKDYSDSKVIITGHGDHLFRDKEMGIFFRSSLEHVRQSADKVRDAWVRSDYGTSYSTFLEAEGLPADGELPDHDIWVRHTSDPDAAPRLRLLSDNYPGTGEAYGIITWDWRPTIFGDEADSYKYLEY